MASVSPLKEIQDHTAQAKDLGNRIEIVTAQACSAGILGAEVESNSAASFNERTDLSAKSQDLADNTEVAKFYTLLSQLEALIAQVESTRDLTQEQQEALANPTRHAWIQAIKTNANLAEAADQATAEHELATQSAGASAGLFSSAEAVQPKVSTTKGFGNS